MKRFCGRSVVAALTVLGVLPTTLLAQPAPVQSEIVRTAIDSGWVANNGHEAAVIWSAEVGADAAPWLRLAFDEVVLSGDPAGGTGSILRITSVLDGHQHRMNAVHVGQWGHTSAYMNGDTVLVEIYAQPGTGANRVVISEFTAGVGGPVASPETICGSTDDRMPSDDPRSCRLLPPGCSAWLYNDPEGCGNSFGTAGHCTRTNMVAQFNVPFSTGSGGLVNPPPEDQYPVEPGSIQSTGLGGNQNDAAIFRTFANSNTGLTPAEAQGGDVYTLVTDLPNVQVGDLIRITGYGTTGSGVPRSWNQIQKTHVGPFAGVSGLALTYVTDTTGGNSGSPIILESTGEVIGVHGYGGCTSTSGSNSGTAVTNPAWQNFRANPQGTCIPFVSCYADCTGEGNLDIFDFICFQDAFAISEPYADCTGEGTFDIFDFICFQDAFSVGCP